MNVTIRSSAPIKAGSKGIVNNVQALRAIAAFLVVLDHLNAVVLKSDPSRLSFLVPFQCFGQAGVDLFFVISGFVMVATSWNDFGSIVSSRSFLIRRLLRIYPPYWILILPIATAYIVAGRSFMHARGGNVDVAASLLLLPSSQLHLLDVSWTLTFEIFFYIVFALILIVNRRFLLPLLGVWALGEIAAVSLWSDAANPWISFIATPLPLEFITGALIGYLFRSERMPFSRILGSLGLAIAVIVFLIVATHPPDAKLTNLRLIEFGIPASLVIYGAVGSEVHRGVKAPGWLVELGNSSYATYLWHSPVILICALLATRFNIHGTVVSALAVTVTLCLVYVVSTLAYRRLERPLTIYLNKLVTVHTKRKGYFVAGTPVSVGTSLICDKPVGDFVS